jgi:ATP-dependent Clp protease adapter protein ClpS
VGGPGCGHVDDALTRTGTARGERKAARTKPPSLYQVVMLNDDYTPMEFVVMVLQQFFQRDRTRPRTSC